jgi:hypothetical protein
MTEPTRAQLRARSGATEGKRFAMQSGHHDLPSAPGAYTTPRQSVASERAERQKGKTFVESVGSGTQIQYRARMCIQ